MNAEDYILLARAHKAEALADVLERAGALGADVPLIDDVGRRAAEQLAGVPVSSEETWTMVATLLSTRRAVRAHLAALEADPFAVFDAS